MSDFTWWEVLQTAFVAGIVHVLSGPDHLSALVTVTTGNTPWRAAKMGIGWGIGHSFGLGIVAVIFYALNQNINLNTVGYYADIVVGCFMILLGLGYIYRFFFL